MSPKFVLDLSNDIFFCNISQFSLLKLFNNDYFFDISIAYIHRKINSFMKIGMCSRNVGKQIRRNIGKILLQA